MSGREVEHWFGTPFVGHAEISRMVNAQARRFVPSRKSARSIFCGGLHGTTRIFLRRQFLGQEKSSSRPGFGASGLPCCKVCSIKVRAVLFAFPAVVVRVASSPPGARTGPVKGRIGPATGFGAGGASLPGKAGRFEGVPVSSGFGTVAKFGAGSVFGCTSSRLRRIAGSTKWASLRAPALVKWIPSFVRNRIV